MVNAVKYSARALPLTRVHNDGRDIYFLTRFNWKLDCKNRLTGTCRLRTPNGGGESRAETEGSMIYRDESRDTGAESNGSSPSRLRSYRVADRENLYIYTRISARPGDWGGGEQEKKKQRRGEERRLGKVVRNRHCLPECLSVSSWLPPPLEIIYRANLCAITLRHRRSIFFLSLSFSLRLCFFSLYNASYYRRVLCACVCMHIYIYRKKYYSAIKKNDYSVYFAYFK